MYCEKCGAEITDGSEFCSSCGAKQGESSAVGVNTRVLQAVGVAADKFNEVTGGSGHVELRFRDLFSDAFKRHSKDEAENLFICGTSSTTPSLRDISSEWPRPWVWSRVLFVMVALVIACMVLAELRDNSYVLPSIMLFGAAAVPLAVLVFFFEINIPRNVSITETVLLFLFGGIFAVFAVSFNSFFALADDAGTGNIIRSIVTGLVNQMAVVAVIAYSMRQRKTSGLILKGDRNYILNGMLIGAAVGAGYALITNSGIAFSYWLNAYFYNSLGWSESLNVLFGNVVQTGLFSFGGFVLWGAAEGGALALCEGEDEFSPNQMTHPSFLVVVAICIVLNALWLIEIPVVDAAFSGLGEYIKILASIAVIWIVAVVLINRGLAQVNELTGAVSDGGTGHKTVESGSGEEDEI